MKITIKGNGCKVKLGKDESKILLDALYKFAAEKWNINANDDDEISKQLGLIQWIDNVFED